ncbi:diacylglycerol kinase catalytic region [Cellulomonas flavigena DSM 20109]|uniref:Diacylglycerol kinase catalytic region n=1 Tax=Cellulomonas flavigena (strain ATCC 482 / DSM 20109 / BCRC 11376 / JCM 18109 / NBRC 3775 / NCIMB 8073 / NRS 134) TaxID=446466 RepID=D5ULW1_CELFN|nr:diacylglycerol kinase family protein [Cellulomonas flavigena]ADG76067.1 diacylglycerol kinase catalytic region [Cellulomonas flavigena DSM 20109]
MTWVAWVAVVAGVLALVAVGLGLWVWRQQRALGARVSPAAPAATEAVDRPAGQLVAFVANPSKPDVADLRAAVRKAAAEQYLPEPLWLETTVEDPGVGQAREAVEKGADLVVAVGGDGTVRAVAEALAGTGVPMGLMPLGTGNLLARNLDVPVGDPLAALQLALDGVDKPIDVGWLRVERWESQMDDDIAEAADDLPDDTDVPRDHIFLVIAGLGFDAAMVADADDELKAKVGWIAYFMAGVRHLHGRRLRVRLTLDDHPPQQLRARSLLVGNCGRLPGGITLLPDAVLDDGVLDIASIDTRGGIAGWAQLFGEVVLQGVGVRNESAAKIGRIDHARARRARIQVAGGEHVQVDGDIVGRASEVTARVDPAALVVRVAG